MATNRRMGQKGSAVGSAMLDAAETILREEGYGALTSRRVAELTGVKQRLVYYYFATMDELIVDTFRRLSVRELERLGGALGGERPLREVWDVCIHTGDSRMIAEFMALAHRNAGLRAEVIAFIEQSRRMQVAALERAMTAAGKGTPALPPVAAAILASSAALAVLREAAIGVEMGHAELLDVIGSFIGRLEPGG
ncbi:MAG TPA: TetR/AcrR family transcriptional regulator [Sphingobium sp.]|uniref:TetR/AcrR family transcriptional regulator n=1 Tax=Sphingobium sp. TaxID=1912891 RepID=UPI002ED19853